MDIRIRQLSSLDKVFAENTRPVTEIAKAEVLRGERFSYQLEICSESGLE